VRVAPAVHKCFLHGPENAAAWGEVHKPCISPFPTSLTFPRVYLFEFVIPVYDPVIRPIATSVSSLGSAVIAVKEIGTENRTSLLGSQVGRIVSYNIGNSCCVQKKKKRQQKYCTLISWVPSMEDIAKEENNKRLRRH
jgi:hypothetical protein